MRAFIAIELSPEIKDSLAQVQSHLKYSAADVKWIENSNVHLTLRFLGDITEEKCEEIKSMLDEISKSSKSFEISTGDIGAFPNINYPRVIWVGLDKGTIESVALAKKINNELLKTGFQKEQRPFSAHLTIGRVRSPKNKEALEKKIVASNSLPPTPNSQLISSIALFQSTLTPKGAIYTKLHEAKLK
ncbi:MAG: RNA 2',3'-cyclic phosphodiesterase [Candidatus Omnitrophota bacterium]|nr:RNA 2',3'-cyclic phosphodiesterase [Candidatus Omnitrophota bacterium]